MANVVEFIVKAKDEATRVINDIAKSVGNFASSFGGMKGVGVNLAIFNQAFEGIQRTMATAQSAIRFFGADLAQVAENLERQSEVTGTSVKAMQVLQQVFEDEGLAAEDATKALTFLNRAIGRGEPMLKDMGITTRDASEALFQLGQRFRSSDDAARKQAIALELTGRSSSQAIKIYESLGTLVPDTAARLKASGLELGDAQLKMLAAVDRSVEVTDTKWKGLVRTIQAGTAPAVKEANDFWGQMLDGMKRFVDGQIAESNRLMDAENELWRDRWRRYANGEFGFGRPPERAPYPQRIPEPTPYEMGADYPTPDSPLFPPSGPPLPPIKSEETERQKRIKETAKYLRINIALAEKYVGILEGEEERASAQKLVDDLIQAGVPESELRVGPMPGMTVRTPPRLPMPQLGPLADENPSGAGGKTRLAMMNEELKKADKGWRGLAGSVRVAIIDMDAQLKDMLDGYTVATDLMNGLASGLSSSLDAIFQGMRDKTGTFKGAMKSILSSLVTEALAILNRLAVAAALEWLLNIVFPGLGTGGRTVIKGVQSIAEGARAGDNTQMVVNINAMDRAGIARALEAPRGELRSAMRSVSLAGAY